MKFNPFMLKYILSEDFVTYFGQQSGITNVRFDATANVEDPQKFFANMSQVDLAQYSKFGEEVVRCEINQDVFYIFFRNAREDRPDIGSGRYTFAKPSSIEIGYVDNNGAYVSFYKEHYSKWFGSADLTATDKQEVQRLTKSIEYCALNALITHYNTTHNCTIALKPVDANGNAIFTASTNPLPKPANPSVINPIINTISQKI